MRMAASRHPRAIRRTAVPSRLPLPTAGPPVEVAAAAAACAPSCRRSPSATWALSALSTRCSHTVPGHRRCGSLRHRRLPGLLSTGHPRTLWPERRYRSALPSRTRQIDSKKPPRYTRGHRIGPLPGGFLFPEWVAFFTGIRKELDELRHLQLGQGLLGLGRVRPLAQLQRRVVVDNSFLSQKLEEVP